MITLRLTNYTAQEVDKLAKMLSDMQKSLVPLCQHNPDCKRCPFRHLCVDLTQAGLYAEEYTPD